MLKKVKYFIIIVLMAVLSCFGQNAKNPIIWSDVPDASMVRVGDTYYMTSTTMHLSPGVPIMKSKNLVNWELVNYAYDRLAESANISLNNGEDAYGKGSWASSIKYKDGTFYILTFSYTTGRSHIYITKDIENGPYSAHVLSPLAHDADLLMDDDGRNYLIFGHDNIEIKELNAEATDYKPGGLNQVIINKASSVAGSNFILTAEGTQVFKINGYYYVMNICWPQNNGRTVTIHRSRNLTGPYEGRVALSDQGVAQGGLISTPEGKWYAYLFKDNGAVGRIPYLVPITWENDWPVFGIDGKVPTNLDIPLNGTDLKGIIASDDFNVINHKNNGLKLEWQWNHNPVADGWSLTARPGYLRLINQRLDQNFLATQNTLTQRSIGPESVGSIAIDVSNMKDGDVAGLGALQFEYGYVAVKMTGNTKSIVMVHAKNSEPTEIASVPLEQNEVHLRIRMDFVNQKDEANFYYSLDGNSWQSIGNTLRMTYKLEHFMGYRFALFNYATKNTGGYVDFDHYIINDYPFDVVEPPKPHAVPGKIEAEAYFAMEGVQTEADADGNINMGWINSGDWAHYQIEVAEASHYQVVFKVASNVDGDNSIVLKNGANEQIGSLKVDNSQTAGWHDWYLDSTIVFLEAGSQLLKLEFVGSDDYLFNIDWLELRKTQQVPTNLEKSKITRSFAAVYDRHSSEIKLQLPAGMFKYSICDVQGKLISSGTIEASHNKQRKSIKVNENYHGLRFLSVYNAGKLLYNVKIPIK